MNPTTKRSSSQVRDSSHSKTGPAPAFASSALEIYPSPPLTSSLNSRSSASSAQESAYLRQAVLLKWCRIALSIVLLGIGAAILGCEGHALYSYNTTHLEQEWYLPLWPLTIDIKPAVGTLVSGAVVTGLSLIYLIVAVIPSPRSRTLHHNFLFTATTILGLTAAIFALAYTTYITTVLDAGNGNATLPRDTVQSWTCRLYNGAKTFNADALSLQLPTYKNLSAPMGFGTICKESKTAYGIIIAMLCVEFACVAVSIVGLLVERRIWNVRKARMDADGEKWQLAP